MMQIYKEEDMDYYEAYQSKDQLSDLRREMVKYAMKKGIKPAARHFRTSIKTVKKWVNHFRESSHLDMIE